MEYWNDESQMHAPAPMLLKNPMNASTRLSMNGKIFNDFDCSSVLPEVLEG